MFFPTVQDTENQRSYVNAFLGYNHNPVISDGELYDMKNLSSDSYPLLSPRAPRDVELSIADEEWIMDILIIDKSSQAELSYVEAIYESQELNWKGTKTGHLTFTIDPDFIRRYKVEVFENDKVIFSENSESTTYDGYFTTCPASTKLKIKITAEADPDVFVVEDMDLYVSGITLYELNENIRGILIKNSKLAYMIGSKLYYNGTAYDFNLTPPYSITSQQQLISFGAYILIFPMGLYFNTADPTDMGTLGAKVSGQNLTITYELCDSDGNDYQNVTTGDTEPATPSQGDLWLKTGIESPGLYVYSSSQSMWIAIPTTYIKITVTGKDLSDFSQGDAVFMNTKFEDLNNGSIIRKIGTDYIVVTGIMDTTTDSETIDFNMERKIPEMDFVCVSRNRVWGCYAGTTSDGTVTNEIYASALGDPKNWYVYDGTSADSYALSLGDDGDFTGAIAYQNTPLFFKENAIYKIYGAYPAAYELYTYECRGVQKGSERSLAICGEYLIYKSIKDVCVFDGNSPTGISEKLGDKRFYKAAGGASLNKYYLSMEDQDKNHYLFVYDMDKGIWIKEDDLNIKEFAYNVSGMLYGQSGLKLYGFADASENLGLTGVEHAEEYVNWEAETGQLGYYAPGHKYVKQITIRAEIPLKAEIKVSVSYDGKKYEQAGILRGRNDILSQTLRIICKRCDHYSMKFEGHHDAKIYSITTTYEEGSEDK